MTPEDVSRWREDAEEDLRRPKPTAPGGQHIRMLTDPRDRKIVALCDEVERLQAEVYLRADVAWNAG